MVWKKLRDPLPRFWSNLKELQESLVFCFWTSLKEPRGNRFFFKVDWKNLGNPLSCFWNNLKESRGPIAFYFWSSLEESPGPPFVLFFKWFKRILGIPWLVFEVIWNSLGHRLCFAFEVVWKNHGDPLCLIFEVVMKESRRTLISGFWSNFCSWGPLLFLKWFEKSRGYLVFYFLSSSKNHGNSICLVFEEV